MVDINEWRVSFEEALAKKQRYLSETKIPELKDMFTEFRTIFSTLYEMLLRMNFIADNPYKTESRVIHLEMPNIAPLRQAEKFDDFSMRLSQYDNQLEFIATFFTFSIEMLKSDKIKILRAVIWFIDWNNLSPSSPSINTQTMAELMIKVRNARSVTSNLFTIKGFDANFGALFRIASEVDSILKDFDDYYREAYKGEIRAYIAANMSGDITFDIIKANFPTAFQGQPFHAELVEELITEDYSSDAQAARQKALKKLALEDDESETEKAAQAGRLLLIDGLHTLGSIGDILQKIIEKIEHNHEIYRNRKKTFAEMIMEFIALMFSKKRMADFYECEMPDANDSKTEIIDYHLFVEELNNKVKILLLFIVGGTANIKLENISDSEILEHINQNIYDIQRYSRLLTALDEFFKTKTDKHNKIYIKGIKPEISTIKIALSKVIQKKEYYLAGEKFLEQLPI